jgi:hypothetical protein
VEAQAAAIRGSSSSAPLNLSRRGDEVVLPAAARAAAGVVPATLKKAVEPVFRRPSIEQTVQRPEATPLLGARAAAGEKPAEPAAPRAAAAPAFEWIHLEIVPPGKKPDPRGYAVYSGKQPQPEPVPVILIDTAA